MALVISGGGHLSWRQDAAGGARGVGARVGGGAAADWRVRAGSLYSTVGREVDADGRPRLVIAVPGSGGRPAAAHAEATRPALRPVEGAVDRPPPVRGRRGRHLFRPGVRALRLVGRGVPRRRIAPALPAGRRQGSGRAPGPVSKRQGVRRQRGRHPAAVRGRVVHRGAVRPRLRRQRHAGDGRRIRRPPQGHAGRPPRRRAGHAPAVRPACPPTGSACAASRRVGGPSSNPPGPLMG